jgi:hypothetical protein
MSARAARRLAAALAALVAAAVVAIGIARGTWAVGGSDSSCYALMAQAFARGQVQPSSPLALRAPWPDASRTLAPAGFLPAPRRADAASPICAPGFALALAPLHAAVGSDGIFFVSPLAGGVLVWLAFALGRHLAGPAVGVCGAIATASIPVLLFQVVQPMNDVLAAALWMLAIVSLVLPDPSRPWALGASAGLAVLVRPNLAPAAVVISIWLLVMLWRRDGCSRALLRAAVAIGMSAAPSAALLVWLHATLYGHVLHSGYGTLGELFAVSNLGANAQNYGAAIWETERAFPLLGVLALVVAPRQHRALASSIVAVAATVATIYLLYRPFPEWWYLRFLLPGLAPMSVLACATLAWVFARAWPSSRAGPAAAVLVTAAITAFHVATPATEQALDLRRLERRFRTTGHLVRDRFSERAAFLTVWESGTLRYHAGRETILWDSLAPESLDEAVAWVASAGFDPFIVTEEWEEPAFRARFAATSLHGALDWPPRFEVDRLVRIYRPSDRAPYLAGDDVVTEYILTR